MYPKELTKVLRERLSYKEPLPTFIWGAPGVGKSAIVAQVAEELGYEVRTLVASTCDPVDLRGCLAIDNGFSIWKPPKFFHSEGDQKVLYFFDELNTATPAVQTAFFRIILEGKLDNIDISTCPRIAAGNRATDMAAAQRMPTPLVSRFLHNTLEPTMEDWKDWAYKAGVKSEVISFLNFRSELLHKMPKDRDTPFPTPRTWEFLSKVIDCHGSVNAEIISGVVGEGVAMEFTSFLDIFEELPSSPKEILDKKVKFKQPDRQYAVNGILANHFRENQKKDVVEKVMKYSYNLTEEFAVILIKDCLSINKVMVSTTKEWTNWANKYNDVVL